MAGKNSAISMLIRDFSPTATAFQNLPDDEFRDLVWHLGLQFEKLASKERMMLVKNVCVEAERRDASTHFWALASLRDAFFTDLFVEKGLYIKSNIKLAARMNRMNHVDFLSQLSTLHRAASSTDQKVIAQFAKQFLPDEKYRLEYEDSILRIYSESDHRIRNDLQPKLRSSIARANSQLMDSISSSSEVSPKNDVSCYTQRANSLSQDLTVGLIVPEFLSGRSFLQPPLGLLYAASYLRHAKFSVKFVDNRVHKLSIPALASFVRGTRIFFVTTTPYDQVQNYFVDYRLRHAIRTANYLKEAFPDSCLVVCGSHGTVKPDFIFRYTKADIVILGEYERTILLLSEALRNDEKIDSIPNIAIRLNSDDGKFSATETDENLMHPQPNSILPAYDLIDFGKYFGDSYINNRPTRIYKWGLVLGSRGCRYKCSFCYNFWGPRVRYSEPEAVVEEMRMMESRHGVRNLFFCDATFTQNREWLEKLCILIRRQNVKIKWACQTRCDLVEQNLVDEMAASGCQRLWFGIESFAGSIVHDVNKYNSGESALDAVRLCRKSNIEPSAFLMIGLPGETKKTLNHTIAMVHSLKIPYTKSIIIATPRFGTAYYKMAKQQYPWIGDSFFDLNAVRGLVGNELTPTTIQDAVDILSVRSFIMDPIIPTSC